jgi:hypothetical protein
MCGVMGDLIFLMNKYHIGIIFGVYKHFIAVHRIVSSVFGDMFHGAPIENGVYKVKVNGVMKFP